MIGAEEGIPVMATSIVSAKPSYQKWFYKIEHLTMREPMQPGELHQLNMKLDDLGGEGWEAVSVVPSGTQVGHAFVLFKRPRE
jgi:hypothetical protein